MVSALGAAGYSAVDYYGNCNMQNPEALAAFGEAVSAGNDAQAGYFVVHPDGLVHEEVLIYRSGAASVVTKDVPDYAVAVGNPARVIKYRDKERFSD